MENSKILFVAEDNEASRFLIEQLMVEAGYFVAFKTTPKEGLITFRDGGFDLIITNPKMQDTGSVELIKELKRSDPDCVIVALLDDHKQELMEYLLDLGVYDFITKPIDLEKLLFLVRKGIDIHTLMATNRKLNQGLRENNFALEKQNMLLAKRVEDSTKNLTQLYKDLQATYMRTVKVLAQAIDARDHYTHSHSENVAKYAMLIATEMALSAKEIETISRACELHDLGKIGIGDSILVKNGPLTDEEWKEIRKHPSIGAQILEPLTFLSDVIELVRQHHEHYDGKGYPEGRRGEDIRLGARIINLADAYEAMRSARSYRKIPLTKEAAVEEIKKHSGTQFDPQVVDAFLRVLDRL